jgi:hypothetical protein
MLGLGRLVAAEAAHTFHHSGTLVGGWVHFCMYRNLTENRSGFEVLVGLLLLKYGSG